MAELDASNLPMLGDFFSKLKKIPSPSKNTQKTEFQDEYENNISGIKESVETIDVETGDCAYPIKLSVNKKQYELILQSIDIYQRLGLLQLGSIILPCIQNNKKLAFKEYKTDIIFKLKEIRNLLISKNSDFSEYKNDYSDWSLNINNNIVHPDIIELNNLYNILSTQHEINK